MTYPEFMSPEHICLVLKRVEQEKVEKDKVEKRRFQNSAEDK